MHRLPVSNAFASNFSSKENFFDWEMPSNGVKYPTGTKTGSPNFLLKYSATSSSMIFDAPLSKAGVNKKKPMREEEPPSSFSVSASCYCLYVGGSVSYFNTMVPRTPCNVVTLTRKFRVCSVLLLFLFQRPSFDASRKCFLQVPRLYINTFQFLYFLNCFLNGLFVCAVACAFLIANFNPLLLVD